jgi:hypothetical protein
VTRPRALEPKLKAEARMPVWRGLRVGAGSRVVSCPSRKLCRHFPAGAGLWHLTRGSVGQALPQ